VTAASAPDIDSLSATLSLPAGVTLREHVDGLQASGVGACAGSNGTYWIASSGIVRRLPTFDVGTPAWGEVDHVLRTTGALVATYVTEPDEDHLANAWLYLCSDRGYSVPSLAPAMRRNLRRASRELVIAPLTGRELLAQGTVAFCDTRRRSGLNDGTADGFRRHFASRIDGPGGEYVGAWKGDQLAAFAAIARVDDWAELSCFSMTSMLQYRPNDALMYAVLSLCLADRSCRVVSYGLSSLQARSNAAGLHRFKLKVGFSPYRVHRVFVFHPSVRPVANRVTLTAAHWAANRALQVCPRDRRLKKLGGMLACMLGQTSMMYAAERPEASARRGHAAWARDAVGTT
jgi:hypothetical protein